MEEWRRVKDWPYEVSSTGRVRSINRYVTAFLRRGVELVKSKKLLLSRERKLKLNRNGYLQVMLKNEGKLKMVSVHRLVLKTFSNNKGDGLDVNHKNLIKTDNRLENLEWVTKSENMKHAVRNGRMHTEKQLDRYKKMIGNKFAQKKRSLR